MLYQMSHKDPGFTVKSFLVLCGARSNVLYQMSDKDPGLTVKSYLVLMWD